MNSVADRGPSFVGLDYSEKSVQVCVLAPDGGLLGNRSCPNDWQAIARFAGQFGPVRRAAIESCGGAADLTDELANLAGWSVDLAHPGYVARLRQSPDKSDYSDGRLLADLTRTGYLPKVWLAPQEVRELRRLVRLREARAQQRRAAKLKIGALLRQHRRRCPHARPWTAAWRTWLATVDLPEHSRWIVERELAYLKYLQEDLAAVEKRLAQATADDPVVARLREQAGIGPVTAWVLRGLIGRFERFRSGKQLARFCSVSPRNASSGTRQADAGLIRAGDPLLRTTLIEMGQRLMRMPGRWRTLGQALVAAGKPWCVVVAAVANRYVRWLWHVMQPETPGQAPDPSPPDPAPRSGPSPSDGRPAARRPAVEGPARSQGPSQARGARAKACHSRRRIAPGGAQTR